MSFRRFLERFDPCNGEGSLERSTARDGQKKVPFLEVKRHGRPLKDPYCGWLQNPFAPLHPFAEMNM